MAKNTRRRVVTWLIVLVVIAGVAGAIWWRSRMPKAVEVIRPRRGRLEAFFREPARTRLANTYRITMPVAGRIGRIDLEPGDVLTAGQEVVAFDRVPFLENVQEAQAAVDELKAAHIVKQDQTLEGTARKQSAATVTATEETVKSAQAQVDASRARSERANKELTRVEDLARSRTVPETTLDDARLAAETGVIDLRDKQFSLAASYAMLTVVKLMPDLIDQYVARKKLEAAVVEHQLKQAEARLTLAEHQLALARVTAPITGRVLERYDRGDRSLAAGQPLLLMGNLAELEVIADVLTEDALKLTAEEVTEDGRKRKVGSRVTLEPASGRETIPGTVKRIEPQGFTKLSSLGVEQQRVNVIVAFDKGADLKGLGVDYRLQARFITGADDDVLILPRSAVMQSPDGDYYVFKIADGLLKKQPVTLGLTSDRELQITDGLTADDVVIARPDATMKVGARVKPKEEEE